MLFFFLTKSKRHSKRRSGSRSDTNTTREKCKEHPRRAVTGSSRARLEISGNSDSGKRRENTYLYSRGLAKTAAGRKEARTEEGKQEKRLCSRRPPQRRSERQCWSQDNGSTTIPVRIFSPFVSSPFLSFPPFLPFGGAKPQLLLLFTHLSAVPNRPCRAVR